MLLKQIPVFLIPTLNMECKDHVFSCTTVKIVPYIHKSNLKKIDGGSSGKSWKDVEEGLYSAYRSSWNIDS